MESFLQAKQMMIDGLETDIYITKDGELVLSHHKTDPGFVELWHPVKMEPIIVNLSKTSVEELQELMLMDKKQKVVLLKEFL